MAVMLSDCLLNDLVVSFQQPQRAGFIRAHLAAEADDVGEHDRGQLAGLGVPGAVLCHRGDYQVIDMWLSNSPRTQACSEHSRTWAPYLMRPHLVIPPYTLTGTAVVIGTV